MARRLRHAKLALEGHPRLQRDCRAAPAINSCRDTESSGLTGSAAGTGKTTSKLQSATRATGIYADGNPNYQDSGTSSQYHVLKYDGLDGIAQRC